MSKTSECQKRTPSLVTMGWITPGSVGTCSEAAPAVVKTAAGAASDHFLHMKHDKHAKHDKHVVKTAAGAASDLCLEGRLLDAYHAYHAYHAIVPASSTPSSCSVHVLQCTRSNLLTVCANRCSLVRFAGSELEPLKVGKACWSYHLMP